MPSNNKKQSRFTKKTENGSLSQQTKLSNQESNSRKLYHTITDLPLSIYITCVVDHDLSGLVISGQFEDSEIQQAWNDIQSEYADIVGDQDMKKYLASYKKYCFYEVTIAQGELLLTMIPRIILHGIQIGKDFHLYGHVQEARHTYVEKFNRIFSSSLIFTDETFEADIESGRAYLKGLSLRMDIEAEKLKKLESAAMADKKPVTRQYFYDTLITLSDHSKVKLDDSMTAYEFAQRIKRFEDYQKSFQTITAWQKSS